MICLTTHDHKIAFANRAFREKFGESRGRPFYQDCFGLNEARRPGKNRDVLEAGLPCNWEFTLTDGSVIDAYAFPFTDTDGHIDVEVADEGAGFDPDQIGSRISKDGLGMGLFGIRERLGYLGGTMAIDSAPGEGASFTLIVPASGEATEIPNSPVTSATSVAYAGERESEKDASSLIRIVLVDDHLVMRQGLASLLGGEPDMVVVGEASDGMSAIDLVRNINPTVVLMDISMPGMDGIEATRRIHEQMPDVKIIGLSMFQEGEHAAAIVEAGAVKYLAKSGPADAVVEAIRNCIQPDGAIVK